MRPRAELRVNRGRSRSPLVNHASCPHIRPQPAALVPENALTSPASPSPGITIYSSAICPYCVMAKNFLKSRGLGWTEVRIDLDAGARQKMVALARRTSVPQIFIGETHVGGYDDMMALHRAGKFESLLAGASA